MSNDRKITHTDRTNGIKLVARLAAIKSDCLDKDGQPDPNFMVGWLAGWLAGEVDIPTIIEKGASAIKHG